MSVIVTLAAIGAIYLFLLAVDSLWSVVELVTSFLTPYFQPHEVQTLAKRFGPWAGG